MSVEMTLICGAEDELISSPPMMPTPTLVGGGLVRKSVADFFSDAVEHTGARALLLVERDCGGLDAVCRVVEFSFR